MKKLLLLSVLCLSVFALEAQIKVDANGDVGVGTTSPDTKLHVAGAAKMDSSINVGADIGTEDAFVKIGTGRSADGNAYFDLVGDASAYPNFALRFIRNTAGESRITHRGGGPLIFNAPDVGGSYLFKILGNDRVSFTGGAILPQTVGATNCGTNSFPWANVYSNNYVTTSDERLKDDIQDLEYGLDAILKLRPVSYIYRANPEQGTHLGLIAQEVDQVIDEIVYDYAFDIDEEALQTRGVAKQKKVDAEFLTMTYTELIPVLIKAVQDQQDIIDEKDDRIASLESRMEEIEKLITTGKVETNITKVELNGGKAWIAQNTPNPFNTQTVIEYFVPETSETAQLHIFDTNGRLMKQVDMARGNGRLVIEANELRAGSYAYSFVVDGEIVETKRMVLTN